ncbi:DUF4892 domain-containing protein [Aliikangiella sp. IMCC44632]
MQNTFHMKIWLTLLTLAFSFNLVAADLFSQLPNSKLEKKQLRHFDHYQIITDRQNNQFKTLKVMGKVERYHYTSSKTDSAVSIYNNYLNSIKSAAGEILFQCAEQAECGKLKRLQNKVKPLSSVGHLSPYLVTAKINKDKTTIYTSVLIFSTGKFSRVQVDIITKTPPPLDLVKLNPDFLDKATEELKISKLSLKDKKGSKDHPLLTRLPKSVITKYQAQGFLENHLVSEITKGSYKKTQVSGKTTRIGYQLPREYSEAEVVKNYQNALTKAGFTQITACEGNQCGSHKKFAHAINSLVDIGSNNSQKYLLAKLERAQGNIWASIYVIGYTGGLWANVHLVEESALNNERISIDLEALTNGIEQHGHIALDGLLFKYDSDDLLKESDPVLKQVAQYVKSQPDKLFYVIGHTDDKGAQAYNYNLANKRASRVVDLLVKQYKVNKKQLASGSAGELVPAANNLTEAGREQNRRVELVLRSDNL